MEEELYSFDRYNDHKIFVIYYNNMYYGEVQLNGTSLISNIKSNSGDGCLAKCKKWIDECEETP